MAYLAVYRARLTVTAYVEVDGSDSKEAYCNAPGIDDLEGRDLVWLTPEGEEINPKGADKCYPEVVDIEFEGLIEKGTDKSYSWEELECLQR